MLAWFLDKPITVRPVLVSKLNTVAQILFVCLVLASLGFGLNTRVLTLLVMAAVTVLTLMSMAVYVRDWVRHMNSPGTMET